MISVIIPHANSLESLTALLNSLSLQQCETPFEVIVVANPLDKYPAPPTLEFNFPLLWQASTQGANAARQKGVSIAQGLVLLFLDDDCQIQNPLFLKMHWDRHQQNPQLTGLGGPYRLINCGSFFGRTYNKLQNQWLRTHRLPGGFCMHLLGGNSSYKRDIFLVESYNEKILFGGTETEFQIRLHQGGFHLKFFADLPVEHKADLSLRDFLKKSFKQGIGERYIASLHRRPAKFVFAEGAKSTPGLFERLTEWLYQVSFDAGRKYYVETQGLTANNQTIYKKVLEMIPRKIFAKDFFVWREGRTLSRVLAKNLLVSKHNSDQDSADNPDKT